MGFCGFVGPLSSIDASGGTLHEYPFMLVHDGCGKAAVYLSEKPQMDDLIDVRKILLLTGRHPEPSEEPKCGSCGAELIMGVDVHPSKVFPRG